MGTRIRSFKEYLIVDHDKEFYLNIVSTFVMKVLSLTEKSKKKQSLPSSPRIKQIQAGWKGKFDIMKSLKEKCTLLKDKKSVIFFKVSNSIS